MQTIYFLERMVYMPLDEDKKEERQVAETNNPIYFIGGLGSAVVNRAKRMLPNVISSGVQAARQCFQKMNSYSVDDNELRSAAKGFAGRNPDASLDSGEKVTKFNTMLSPIPELYSEFKRIKSHEGQENLKLDKVIELLSKQKDRIEAVPPIK